MSHAETVTLAVAELDECYAHLRLPQPRAERAMASSMQRYGQLSPIVGCERGDRVAVVDGFKRLHAARRIGLDALVVRLVLLSERAAVAAIYGMNKGARGLADLEEGLVVRELVRGHHMTQPEVGELLGRHKSWVSRRLSLVERLDEQVQQDVRVGLVPVTVARELVRLPRGNQPEVAAAIHRHGLTTRDGALLVTLLEKTVDREQQQALLAEPREVLEAQRAKAGAVPVDPRLGAAANRVRRTAAQLVESLSRLERQLQEVPTASTTRPERQVLGPALRQVARVANRVVGVAVTVATSMEAADAP